MLKTPFYKYNFFKLYGELKQNGNNETAIRYELLEGLDIRIETLRKWEKIEIDDPFSLNKAQIDFICKVFECKEAAFIAAPKKSGSTIVLV
jgi:hypothetical protein